ncbi:UNVERIFIED_CONTAM: hypothetical protein K2H54_056500 [Gekko kuhli]
MLIDFFSFKLQLAKFTNFEVRLLISQARQSGAVATTGRFWQIDHNWASVGSAARRGGVVERTAFEQIVEQHGGAPSVPSSLLVAGSPPAFSSLLLECRECIGGAWRSVEHGSIQERPLEPLESQEPSTGWSWWTGRLVPRRRSLTVSGVGALSGENSLGHYYLLLATDSLGYVDLAEGESENCGRLHLSPLLTPQEGREFG